MNVKNRLQINIKTQIDELRTKLKLPCLALPALPYLNT